MLRTRCELSLTGDRRSEQIETSLVFKTVEGMPLPAGMNAFFDADDWLGTDAKVEGTVTMRQEGRATGRLCFRASCSTSISPEWLAGVFPVIG